MLQLGRPQGAWPWRKRCLLHGEQQIAGEIPLCWGDQGGWLPATDLPDFQDKVLPNSATELLQCTHGLRRIRLLPKAAHPLIIQGEEGSYVCLNYTQDMEWKCRLYFDCIAYPGTVPKAGLPIPGHIPSAGQQLWASLPLPTLSWVYNVLVANAEAILSSHSFQNLHFSLPLQPTLDWFPAHEAASCCTWSKGHEWPCTSSCGKTRVSF